MHQFSSKRLHCRLIQQSDNDFVKGIYTEPSRLKHLQAMLGNVDIDKILNAIKRHNNSGSGSFYWIIEDKQTGESLGIQSVTAMKDILDAAEIGIMMDAKAEGHSYPYEALHAMIQYAFMELNNDVLFETHQSSNRLVCLLAKRLTFNRVNTFYRNGIEHYMTLKLKKDWFKQS